MAAKKSNKTNHVLNLLSSGNDKPEEEETPKASAAKPPVDPNKVGAVSVVQNTEETEQLADSIRDSLEAELEKSVEHVDVEAPQVRENLVSEHTNVAEQIENTVEQVEKVVEKTEPVVPVQQPAPVEQVAPVVQPTPVEQAAPVQQAAPVEHPAPVQQAGPAKMIAKDQIDLTKKFAYVNVMEILVQERAKEYMEKFGVCKCARCVADVQAVALTNLPPVYVVVNENAVSPLINFYRQKYAGELTVEITKACIQIDKVPHHFRD